MIDTSTDYEVRSVGGLHACFPLFSKLQSLHQPPESPLYLAYQGLLFLE